MKSFIKFLLVGTVVIFTGVLDAGTGGPEVSTFSPLIPQLCG